MAGGVEEAFAAFYHSRGGTAMTRNIALWTGQLSLAVIFLVAGGMKLWLPIKALTLPVRLPAVFIRFLGVAEILGATA